MIEYAAMQAAAEAEQLAVQLTESGIPATADSDRVTVKVTIDGAFHRLMLLRRPGKTSRIEWTLTDGHGDDLAEGHWNEATTDRRGWTAHQGDRLHRRETVASVRRWMKENWATAGAPTLPPFTVLIGEEANHWMRIFPLAADHVARALAEGAVTADATEQDLAELYPELTDEHDMLREGWSAGINIIHALASGDVYDARQSPSPDASYQLVIGPYLLDTYGPAALQLLQTGFDGDVKAAAAAFLARALPQLPCS
ncbi:hypothetical protein ACFXPX_36775 [Kitasatospora sp. NPDC059146]